MPRSRITKHACQIAPCPSRRARPRALIQVHSLHSTVVQAHAAVGEGDQHVQQREALCRLVQRPERRRADVLDQLHDDTARGKGAHSAARPVMSAPSCRAHKRLKCKGTDGPVGHQVHLLKRLVHAVVGLDLYARLYNQGLSIDRRHALELALRVRAQGSCRW